VSRHCDVAVIGAGHNGLVCACYLARAGLRVRVFERRERVGGAVATEEFLPGFRNSVAAYTVSLLAPKVMRELRLAAHGLRIVPRPMANFLPLGDDGLCLGGTREELAREFARFSLRDAERVGPYLESVARAAALLRTLLFETPPEAGGGWREALRAARMARRLGRAGLQAQRDLLALVTASAADFLSAWFETEAVRAAFAFDAVVGTYASPYHPGTAYVLLHHAFGEVEGRRGAWGHALGGMGAIAHALAAEARRLGVAVETNAAVARVLLRGGRAAGVALADGREVSARAVAANVDPKLLFLSLVERTALPQDFVSAIERYRCGSASFRMNVALARLPRFAGVPPEGPHLGAGILFAPSLAYMDQAWRDARQTGMSRRPIVEMVIASVLDPSLAPPGAHAASLFAQHFDPATDWTVRKSEAVERIFETVEEAAPGFRASVIGHTALSPADLERDFALTAGDIFHGQLSLDQLWSARPVLGWARYRTPIRGLYLCGSGAHPGGGVTGIPGHNCAREMVRDLRWRMLGGRDR